MPEPKIRKLLISGRELFVLDNVIDEMMVDGAFVKTLHYVQKEKAGPKYPALPRLPIFHRRESQSIRFFAA
jgi:hypothetical protein